jgi:BirA family transcriptional regulator, biotin operon repressor / biotin---[acetyl-CoA-carboxylase] ligase
MERDLALIALLADGRVHSGEAIGQRFGMTRAGVRKALRKRCEELGLQLESIQGRGYRLLEPLELLNPEALLGALSPAGRARLAAIAIHPQIDSTNAFILRQATAGAASGLVCMAERQTAGRGRRGRAWVSPFGVNLYLSILWRYPLSPAALGGLSLAAGTAVAEVLSVYGVRDIALKWPNDLLWRRRKLAGLLLEVAGESQGPSHLVLGLGVNLQMTPSQGDSIDQPWVALDTILPRPRIGRNALAAKLIDGLLEALEHFGQEGLGPFLARWRAFDRFAGERVRLVMGEQVIEGQHAGIGGDGSLLIETAAGLRAFQAGEVSLRTLD